jgi:glycosyltransferase involved in cell wall biosynthesis
LLEAMACGLPCIVTRYSAVTEFASDGTVFFLRRRPWLERVVDPSNFDPALDWGGWACPSVLHLRRLLRHVVDDPASAAAKGRYAALAARDRWTWDHAIAKALAHLDAAA